MAWLARMCYITVGGPDRLRGKVGGGAGGAGESHTGRQVQCLFPFLTALTALAFFRQRQRQRHIGLLAY